MRLVPVLESNPRRFRRLVQATLPVALSIFIVLAASPWLSDHLKKSRESARALPPAGLPNVLLIVLDTVAAGHLGLFGYGRPTSNTLVELADHGITFKAARAASSWTLPSHASIFTGRWMHELSVGWLNPLDGRSQRWQNTWGRAATLRPVSWPTRCSAPVTRASTAVSPTTKISSFPSTLRSRAPFWFIAYWPFSDDCCRSSRSVQSLGVAPPSRTARLAGVCFRPQDGGHGQPRVFGMAVKADRTRASVLCFLELFRCSHAVRVAGWTHPSFRGRSRR